MGVCCSRICLCGCQGGDLYEVVGEYTVSAPGGGAVAAGAAAAGPAVAVFEVADSAFASGSPLDQFAEAPAVFDGSARCAGLSLAGYGNGLHALCVQFGVDATAGCDVPGTDADSLRRRLRAVHERRDRDEREAAQLPVPLREIAMTRRDRDAASSRTID